MLRMHGIEDIDLTELITYLRRYYRIALLMILNFADKETEKVWRGAFSRKLPHEIQQIARRKLRMVNNAVDINDLRIPPANRLEKLKGSGGCYSIRINDQWRVVFRWEGNNAIEVSITDYH